MYNRNRRAGDLAYLLNPNVDYHSLVIIIRVRVTRNPSHYLGNMIWYKSYLPVLSDELHPPFPSEKLPFPLEKKAFSYRKNCFFL